MIKKGALPFLALGAGIFCSLAAWGASPVQAVDSVPVIFSEQNRVPNLVGLSLEEAREKLEDVNMTIGAFEHITPLNLKGRSFQEAVNILQENHLAYIIE